MSTVLNPLFLVFPGERNKSDLMTPAADSSNDFSNNPVVAAQENSEENSEENSDSTAKSSQAGSDNTNSLTH